MVLALPFFLLISFLWQETVPLKASNEFELKINYKFEERPPVDGTKVVYDADQKKKGTGPLPYLRLELTLLKLSLDEIKVKVINSDDKVMFSHKATEGNVIKIDIGFIDDVKDRLAPYEFIAFLYSDTKKTTSQIRLFIMEDGTFMVNDEKRGKF
jgi:hypothetical protein